jgi:DNA transformation protein and related proteins
MLAAMAQAPFVTHCLELLAAAGKPRARGMFGGHGLYVDDLFVALIVRERLYLKADPTTRGRFERAGSEPFAYSARDGQSVTMAYWSAPEAAMDSPAAMQPWLRLALASALRAHAAKASAAARKPRAARHKAQAGPARKAKRNSR